MKKIEFLFVIIMIAFCYTTKSVAQSESFQVEGDVLYYQLIDETHVKVVQPSEGVYTGNITIPASIQYPVQDADPKTAEVIEIDVSAFATSTLTGITLPNTLKVIGAYAFSNCANLTEIAIPQEVTTIGSGAFTGCTGLTEITIPQNVKSIASSVFIDCTGLTGITLHQDITEIGNYAFTGCTKLTGVTLPENLTTIGNNAFSGCTGLTEITIPQKVSSVGNYAFNGCSGLKKTSIIGIKAIGNNAFSGCTGLTEARFSSLSDLCQISFANNDANPLYHAHHLYLGNNSNETFTLNLTTLPLEVTAIGKSAFAGGSEILSVTIPGTVKSFGSDAFNGCKKLQSVDYYSVDQLIDMDYGNEFASPLKYASNVTFSGSSQSDITITRDDVKQYAFANCTWLKKVTVNANTISQAAFMNCKSLTNVELNGVISIANDAFKSCTSLKEITLPSTLQSIGVQAFSNCWVLQGIDIPTGVTQLGNEVFLYCSGMNTAIFDASSEINAIPYRFFYGCSGLQNVQLPNNVTTIGNEAFRGCTSLTALPTSEKLNLIGNNAFVGCNSIQILELPATIRQINKGAFSSCSGLTQLKINNPDNAEEEIKIAEEVFANCNQLQSVYSYAIKAPNADANAFGGRTGMNLYLDEGVDVSTYNKAPWTDFVTSDMSSWNIIYYVDNTEWDRQPYKTGDPVTPLEYNVTKPEGWTFSGWQEEIPTVMPNHDVEIHGFWTIKTMVGDLFYHLDPIQQKATVLQHDSYKSLENLNGVPASIEFVTEEYPNSTYNVVAVANQAFANCTNLTSIELPIGVTVLSDSLFYNCANLVHVTMGADVTEISSSAFNQCSSLSIDVLPAKLMTIGTLAFCKCKGLSNITIPASVTELGDKVFLDCEGLTTVSFSAESPILALPTYTFQNCYKLKQFTLPTAMNTIKNGAFLNCRSLEIIEIPSGIRSIYSSAFNGCSNATQVIIPETLATFGGEVFKSCPKINQVTVAATTPPDATQSLFDDAVYTNATLYVPDGKESNYQNKAPWSSFGKIYARKSHNLTYMVDGKPHGEPISYLTGATIEPIANPTKDKRAFSGWKNLPQTMPDNDVEVTGAFKYEIKYKEGETELYSDSLFYGDPIVPPTELNRDSYTYTLNPSLEDWPTMPAEDNVISVIYLLSETEQVIDGIRYYIYTQTKDGVPPHAEVMPATSGSYTASTITIPLEIDYQEFKYPVTVIRNDAFSFSQNLTTLHLLANIETIGTQAFRECVKLSEIDLPESLIKLGSEAFMYCFSLQRATFNGANLTTLPAYSFMNCESLSEIYLPQSLTSIGNRAFAGCKKLSKIHINDNTTVLPAADENVFDSQTYKDATLHIPQNVSLIAPWDQFVKTERSGEDNPVNKCAKPTISYYYGKLIYACADPVDASFVTEIDVADADNFTGSEKQLTRKYKITVYATKEDYRRSDPATATITWSLGSIEQNGFLAVEPEAGPIKGDVNEDGKVTITDAVSVVDIIVNGDEQGEDPNQ